MPGAKTRLENVLSAGARAALSLSLLRRVYAALRAVDGMEDVVVMTPDPRTRGVIAERGIPAIVDPCPGLNAALTQLIRERGRSSAVAVVAADLPLVRPADIAALLEAARSGAFVLAPSKEGTGTNAMVVPARMPLRTAYGAASRVAHRRAAEGLGREVVEVRRPGLAFDLDTEADLLAFAATLTPY
jgi:2-phospho-L-lactate guanylyltransferase